MLIFNLFYIFAHKLSISFQEMKKDKAARLRAACIVYIIIGAEFSEDSEDAEIAEDKAHALRALALVCCTRALTGAVTGRVACVAR